MKKLGLFSLAAGLVVEASAQQSVHNRNPDAVTADSVTTPPLSEMVFRELQPGGFYSDLDIVDATGAVMAKVQTHYASRRLPSQANAPVRFSEIDDMTLLVRQTDSTATRHTFIRTGKGDYVYSLTEGVKVNPVTGRRQWRQTRKQPQQAPIRSQTEYALDMFDNAGRMLTTGTAQTMWLKDPNDFRLIGGRDKMIKAQL